VYPGLGLPTLQECSHPDWVAGGPLPNLVNTAIIAPLTTQFPLTQAEVYDVWNTPHPYQQQDPVTGSLSYDPAAFPPLALGVEPPRYLGPRVGEDVVLTNVVAFDVKVWDPQARVLPAIDANGTQADLTIGNYWTVASFTDDVVIPGVSVAPGDPGYELALAHALVADDFGGPDVFAPVGYGAYVDLGYMESININGRPSPPAEGVKLQMLNLTTFSGPGNRGSQLKRVYDTWSTHYESNWFDLNLDGVKDNTEPGNENRNSLVDEGTDGIDNPGNGLDDDGNGVVDDNDDQGNGLVDDALEQEAPPPYPVPLRGIQIKIRVFDPDSRQVRERTVVCDFLPK
jgi:hypothetical protein